jgi:hypothetical protein
MTTFETYKEKEMQSFMITPIKSEDAINKTIKEIKRFWEDCGFSSNKLWTVIVFTDDTGLFLDKNHDAITYFSCLTMSYTDVEKNEVSSFIRETGHAFIKEGICSEEILLEACKILKQYRIEQLEAEKAKKIANLKEQLANLEK